MSNHLAILTLDFKPQSGGVQEFLYQIAQRLTTSRQVTVLTPVSGALPVKTAFRRLILPNGKLTSFWQPLRRLQPDRVLIGHAHPRMLAAGWLYGNYAAIAYGNDFLAAQHRWHRPLFNYWLRHARPLLTISQSSQAGLKSCGLADAQIILPGTDPDRFRPEYRLGDNDAPQLLTVGRLVPRKGIDTVLQALPAILKNKTVAYYIAGDGPDRTRLEKIADDLDIANVVHFLGRIPDEMLPQTYANADIFVMPNRDVVNQASQEGFGIVFLEASASGLPVIAGKCGGAMEAVKHGETGLLVSPEKPAELATAVLSLLHDPERRRQMGQAGRRWVTTEMNWERAARQFAAILDNHDGA